MYVRVRCAVCPIEIRRIRAMWSYSTVYSARWQERRRQRRHYTYRRQQARTRVFMRVVVVRRKGVEHAEGNRKQAVQQR